MLPSTAQNRTINTEKPPKRRFFKERWSEWQDSNLRHPAPKAGALPTALHPVIKLNYPAGRILPNHPRYQLRHTRLYLYFSLLPAYYLSAVRPRRFPQKHSRIIQGSQKGLPFWGEDEGRNEWVFAKGGNEWYGAAEDDGAPESLVIFYLF